ncbi:hypothetical protein KFL_000850120 [Klebsormidium nitens]|uniref:Uncharacterized protein n=1 Tax=Klebsormidium nitens TaxID=105231 RepID=A0A1Y1HYI6_KLENI|nr:hypothetical protein KFL_000850120 [Klebsormidium nitens]|eukprot:GAQ81596.1 hypothetical protein KFL_000850120 [Klebsormidium nitens]
MGFLGAILLLSLVLGAFADDNPVYNPCGDAPAVARGDGFTFAVALGSDPTFWHGLSPCDPNLVQVPEILPSGTSMAVFRPKVDELSLIRFNNISLNNLNNQFPGNQSLMVYAGSYPAYISVPKTYRTPLGQVPTFSLVLDFNRGKLRNILWKNEDCKTCEKQYCFNNRNCAVPQATCDQSRGTDPNRCRLALQVAFSGTDKNMVPMQSWYQIAQLKQYSITGLYGQAVDNFNAAIGNVVDNANAITNP